MSDRQDTLQQYVSDMLALNKHIHEATERQINDKHAQKDSNAYPLIKRLDTTLEHQISALESHLKMLGGDVGSPVKDTIGAVAGVAAGVIDKVRSQEVSKMLRDDYTALSLSAMAQTMLHTTGLALKDQATADLALAQLHEITPLIVEISEAIPLVVVRELSDDSEIIDPTSGRQAVENTQKAWSREVAH